MEQNIRFQSKIHVDLRDVDFTKKVKFKMSQVWPQSN